MSFGRISRAIVGVLAILAILLETCVSLFLPSSAATAERSLHLMQGGFMVIVIIGLVICFYVAIRPD
jgi:hypothetical protein